MVISVMDRDRPGIVADVTEGIGALGGNLADLRESVLCGYFTMILSAAFPADVSVEQVKQALTEGNTLNVSIAPTEGSLTEPEDSCHAYVLTAAGQDRVGLVAQVSRFCCERGVNILDLASHVDSSRYTMMLLLDLSSIHSIETFKTELVSFGNTSGLSLDLQHNDLFRATNEI
jgi:glycine cleavage system transcriptional repressor